MKLPNVIAQTGKTIICRGPFCFGFGKDTDTAYKNAKKNVPRGIKAPVYTFVEVPDDAAVSDFDGSVTWKDGSVTEVTIGFGRLAEEA